MAIKDVSAAFRALSDPIRRDILKKLRKRSMTPSELAIHFPISKPSLSHHLNILKNANLIDDERQGQKIYYSLNATVFYDVMNNFLNNFR
ncbi:MAG: autorepressor SdpR family transcription factor [Patescibacteria group bacterium]|nr:autorepressor SdpR family transcription factor [Patescibacteria group bacterium]